MGTAPRVLSFGHRQAMITGAIGAACMSVGACAYAPMPTMPAAFQVVPIAALRASQTATSWGLATCFAGVALLSLSWIGLGVEVEHRRAEVRSVNLTVVAWVVPLLLAPPLFSGDGWSYAAYGYLTGHDLSPYVTTPAVLHGPIVDAVCMCWRNTPAPYGPLPLLWGGAFSRLTANPWLLVGAYRLLALGGLALLLVAAPRLARAAGRPPASASWLAASPFLLADGVGGVHLDLIVVGLIAFSLWLVMAGVGPNRWFLGAVGVGLVAAVKAPAAVAGIGVVLLALPPETRPVARLRTAALVGATIVGTTGALGGLGGLGVGWLGSLHVALRLHTPLSLTYDAGVWISDLIGHDGVPVADAIGLFALAVGCGLMGWRTRSGDPAKALTTIGAVMLLTTVLSPVTNYWYYLWSLPLLACCCLPRWAGRCVTTVTVALGLLAPLDPSLGLPDTGLIQLATVLGAIAFAFSHPLISQVVGSPPDIGPIGRRREGELPWSEGDSERRRRMSVAVAPGCAHARGETGVLGAGSRPPTLAISTAPSPRSGRRTYRRRRRNGLSGATDLLTRRSASRKPPWTAMDPATPVLALPACRVYFDGLTRTPCL